MIHRYAKELVWFSAILLLAAFLRLYRLDQLPPGLALRRSVQRDDGAPRSRRHRAPDFLRR